MESVVNDFTGGVDNDRPGRTARPIFSHDLRDSAGDRITGGMCHGNLESVLQLVLPQFILRIDAVPLENSLHRNEFYPVIAFKRPGQFLNSWEPQLLTPRSPVLEKIKVNDFAAIVR